MTPDTTSTAPGTTSTAPGTATLLRGGVVLPMWPDRRTLHQPGSVLMAGGRIVTVGSVDQVDADPRSAGAQVLDMAGRAVLPGLANCHLHSGLLRGTAEGLALFDWLRTYVDPAHRALTPEIAEAASRLCYAEAALSGTTSVMDMWRFLDGSARVADRLGIRATLVPYLCDEAGFDYFETLETTEALLDARAKHGRVRAWVGLEHPLYCTPEAYRRGAELAERYDVGIHTHSSETQWEVAESVRRFGHRPLHEIARRGILYQGRCVVAHCVWLDDAEIDLLATTGTRVAHCPCSNLKLASGPAPVARLWEAGVVVGLGSDGEKENNSLDLLEEAKFASLLQKLVSLDPAAGDPYDILAMATVEGARCLGLEQETGALRPGLAADVTVVDLQQLHTTPLLSGAHTNAAAHLVFSSRGSDVTDVWVDGAPVVRDGRLLGDDVDAVRADAQAAAEELFARRERLLQA